MLTLARLAVSITDRNSRHDAGGMATPSEKKITDLRPPAACACELTSASSAVAGRHALLIALEHLEGLDCPALHVRGDGIRRSGTAAPLCAACAGSLPSACQRVEAAAARPRLGQLAGFAGLRFELRRAPSAELVDRPSSAAPDRACRPDR